MRVLAGDIGGTKTLLLLADFDGHGYKVYHEQRFESRAWPGLSHMVEEFLQSIPHDKLPENGCFAVAGPVAGSQATLTNLTWPVIDADLLAIQFQLHSLHLINDFQAIGVGLAFLTDSDLAVIQAGSARPHAPRVLIGAGTGLGQSLLIWKSAKDSYEPLETEGGHVDFAPIDEEQISLLRFLRARYSHVSVERILSGAGLSHLYEFVCHDETPRDPAEITALALSGSDPNAIAALNLFVKIYGQHAGNLALTCLPSGGIYLAGGIPPRILPFLQSSLFLDAFYKKGRLSHLLTDIPVRVILNQQVGLIGAALLAKRGF